MKKYLFTFVLMLALSLATQTYGAQSDAQAPQAGKPVAEKNDKAPGTVTFIGLENDGTDSLGAKFVMRLKERFNQSNLFSLAAASDKDKPQLVISVSTQTEFPSRPSIGSIYSICWVFKQGKGYLPFLLKHTSGIITDDGLGALVDSIFERTDGIASRYAHLWK
ncbi:MAG: hypothetical protein K5657_02200 [Desulfovibrio sp.]|nr:hypothetical protein [Desulfovibrio sp.]